MKAPNMLRLTACLLLLMRLAAFGEVHPPAQVTAGKGFSISTTGSGDASFYLISPGHVAKREVKLGQDIPVDASDVKKAGRYLAIACVSGGCNNAAIYVMPAEQGNVSIFLNSSRVRWMRDDAIDDPAVLNHH